MITSIASVICFLVGVSFSKNFIDSILDTTVKNHNSAAVTTHASLSIKSHIIQPVHQQIVAVILLM